MENKIASLLRVANKYLAYSEAIIEFPSTKGMKNFDNTSLMDKFWRNTCNVYFHESLLICGSLLKQGDKRVISLWNWDEFVDWKGPQLSVLTEKYEQGQLAILRNQVIAHQDLGNNTNNLADARINGLIRPQLVKELGELLNLMIGEFRDFAAKLKTPYSDQYFDLIGDRTEMETVLNTASPTLTNADMI